MIHGVILDGDVRLMTKMGITETSLMAEKDFILKTLPNYKEFIQEWCREGLTPIFEYIAPHNRIVIKYDDPELVLIAIRHNITGQYINNIDKAGEEYEIPVVYSRRIESFR